ncbi:MAG: DUF4249 domain-containing protein [Bacteroidales bacterium]
MRKLIKGYPALLAILLTVFFTGSCREIYNHDAGHMENVIIVEGLITDRNEPYVIKLNTKTLIDNNLHDQTSFPTGISDATVYVKDNNDEIFFFTESEPGNYYSQEFFRGISGNTYTLFIETPDGHSYVSEPQSLPFPVNIDSLYARPKVKETLKRNAQGGYFLKSTEGAEVLLDISYQDEQYKHFRLVPEGLILYNFPTGEIQNYLWKKINMLEHVNVSSYKFETTSIVTRQHNVTFFPHSKYEYNINNDEYIHRKILLLKIYGLNKDSWDFYTAIERQINSEGKLFDPVATRLPSNIRCTSDASRLALGLFEASSVVSVTYILVERPWEDSYHLKKTDDLDHLPPNGNQPYLPDFWVN